MFVNNFHSNLIFSDIRTAEEIYYILRSIALRSVLET